MSERKLRISENPDNFSSVFNRAIGVSDDVRSGRVGADVATAAARGLSVAAVMIKHDLMGRVIDHRLTPREIAGQCESQKAA